MLISNAVEVLQCCDRCIYLYGTGGKGCAELGACKFVCEQCTTDHQLCDRCKALNFSSEQWTSITRPCFSCVESQVSYKRVAVCVLASDRLEKQKKILRQLEEKRASSETEDAKLVNKNTGEILIIQSPDDPHTDKSTTITGK